MWNKTYIYLILVIVAVGVAAFFFVDQVNKSDDLVNNLTSPSPTPTLTPDLTLSPTPTTSKPVSSPKPSSGIIIKEDNYEYLALKFDEDGNRRLILNEDCSALVPSQVAYKNGVQIMLDNTYSSKPHILKIGGVDYSLDAGAWILTTLSRTSLPAQLPIFCGAMELGAIELLP